jgi:murein DD-endopeptidase MepM/ murein hydrolase activator NlpD
MDIIKKSFYLSLFSLLLFFSCSRKETVSMLTDDEKNQIIAPLTMDTCITSIYGTRKGGFHNGIDLRTKHKNTSSVFAIADGVVVASENDSAHSGEYVKIYHGEIGIFSVYAHLSSKYVMPGDTVAKGDVIGVAGETGRTFGEHLHFGIKNNEDQFIDPAKWLEKNSILIEKCK